MATIESNTVKLNFFEYVQDTLVMAFKYADDQGQVIDMSGWEVDVEIRKQVSDPEPLLHINLLTGGVVVGGADYNLLITVTDQHTLALGAGTFAYFIRTKDTVGFVNTLALGKITLKSR